MLSNSWLEWNHCAFRSAIVPSRLILIQQLRMQLKNASIEFLFLLNVYPNKNTNCLKQFEIFPDAFRQFLKRINSIFLFNSVEMHLQQFFFYYANNLDFYLGKCLSKARATHSICNINSNNTICSYILYRYTFIML